LSSKITNAPPALERHGNNSIPTLNDQKIWLYLVIVVCALILASPSIVNGFPYIFPDSLGYLGLASTALSKAMAFIFGAAPPPTQLQTSLPLSHATKDCGILVLCANPFYFRPFPYSMFLIPFASGYTIFLVPFVQALFLVSVLVRFFRTFYGKIRLLEICIVVGFLFLATNLSVHVNYVMADVFTGILILYACSSLYSWRMLSNKARLRDLVIMTFLASVHLTHLMLVAGLAVASIFGCLAFTKRHVRVYDALFVLVVPAVLAAALLMASNFLVSKRMVISASSPVFLLARLVDAGSAVDYLTASCPTKKYLICDHLDKIAVPKDAVTDFSVADNFLWGDRGIRRTIGDTRLFVEQAQEINWATIKTYPTEIAYSFIEGGLAQLIRFDDDTVTERIPSQSVENLHDSLTKYNVAFGQYFHGARQYKTMKAGEAFYAGWWQTFHRYTVIGSIVALPIVLMFSSRRRLADSAFPVFLCVSAILINGMITGALSSVHDRYQSRVIWIVPFLLISMVIARERDRQAAVDNKPCPAPAPR
jgi:hypothetical protein